MYNIRQECLTVSTSLNLDKPALQNWLNARFGCREFEVVERYYTGTYCYQIAYPVGLNWYDEPITTEVVFAALVSLESDINEATRQDKLLNMLRSET